MTKEWHVVSCSGGKDSTALVIGMWERGYRIDEVVCCNEGKCWDEIFDVFERIREITGIEVTVIGPDEKHSFDYLMFDKEITMGKRKGTHGYGWSTALNRLCTTFCKVRVIEKYVKQKQRDGYEIIQYVGIAADEAHRTKKEAGAEKFKKLYPLVDWGMTEADCLKFCYDHGIDFGGLYEHFARISCWCCPLMRIGDARSLYHHYPEKWQELKDMDARCRTQFKKTYSVQDLEEKFKAEDAQQSIDF